MRLLRVWLAAGGLCAGVLWGYSHHLVAPALALGAAGISMLGFRRKPMVLLVAVVLAAFGAGALDASLRSARTAAASVLAADFASCHIRGRVLEDQGALGTLIAVQEARCHGFAPILDPGTVMVPGRVAAAGAQLSTTGTFVPLQEDPFDTARRRAGASGLFDAGVVRTQPPSWFPLQVASSIRHGLIDATRSLGPPRRGLVRGLTIGDTTDLDQTTIDDFRRAGLSHLLAVSGENLAMFLGALALVIRHLHFRLRLLAYLASIGLFVLVVGPQPSVLRAAVMGAVMVAAVGRGYRAQPLAVLATALIVVIAFRPALVFSVGLQLSAAATGGIVLWTKPLERMLRPFPRVIALPLAVTISAQSAVAPILIATFGQLSLVSPIANLLAFPAVAVPTVLGLCAGGVSLFNDPAARLLATIAGPFAGWIAFIGRSLGEAPGAAVDLPKSAAWFVAVPVVAAAVAAAARPTE
jgi:ComEC/Rec2-related protein